MESCHSEKPTLGEGGGGGRRGSWVGSRAAAKEEERKHSRTPRHDGSSSGTSGSRIMVRGEKMVSRRQHGGKSSLQRDKGRNKSTRDVRL